MFTVDVKQQNNDNNNNNDMVIRSASVSVNKLVSVLSVNGRPSWLRNADQWKSDYRDVTNEKPRN